MWGAEAGKWETFEVLMKAFNKIVARCEREPRPYIYPILGNGALREEH